MTEYTCPFCGDPVDPFDRHTWRRVVGWERKAAAESRRSGSDIALRELRDEYAHPHCVRFAKDGVVFGQMKMTPVLELINGGKGDND